MAVKDSIRVKLYNFATSVKKAAFIIGTALIVFAALRNSLTWHMQHFWGASHDFWQKHWIKLLEYTEGDEFLLYVVVPWVVVVFPFWMCNIPLLIMDMTRKPAFLYQYKIQDDKKRKITWSEAKHTILVVLRNQLLNIPGSVLFHTLYTWRGLMKHGPELPTFQQVLIELVVFVFLEEIFFYYSHRLLHHPAIYKHIHKIHHEWTTPISITSLYCHPIEYYFSNLIPVMLGPLFYCTHVTTSYLWILIATINTTNAHSGYHFPSFPSNEAHDFHHLKFNEMYGVLGILDRLHNTDAKFRVSKQYERHLHFFSLTPIKKLVPDAPPCTKQVPCCSSDNAKSD